MHMNTKFLPTVYLVTSTDRKARFEDRLARPSFVHHLAIEAKFVFGTESQVIVIFIGTGVVLISLPSQLRWFNYTLLNHVAYV